MALRVVESIARDKAPQTLSESELDLAHEPLTRAPVARSCRAWVRYGDVPVRVDAEAVAWTARAIAVRWKVTEERVDRAWVWSSAVSD